jgi:hypothetical protein
MERVITLTTFEEERVENKSRAYWLSRSPEERISEVERLRREYLVALLGAPRIGFPPRLRRSLLLVERESR